MGGRNRVHLAGRCQPGRPLRASRHRPGARGRAAVSARRRVSWRGGSRDRELPADESRTLDAGHPGGARRDGRVRSSRPRLQRSGVHGDEAVREPVVADLVVPVVAPDRQFRGILQERQRPVRSGHLLALRLSDQRSDLHVGWRSRVRLRRGHPAARLGGRRTAAARSHARREDLRHVRVRQRPRGGARRGARVRAHADARTAARRCDGSPAQRLARVGAACRGAGARGSRGRTGGAGADSPDRRRCARGESAAPAVGRAEPACA